MDKKNKTDAREAALRLLDRRMYTAAEMRRKLNEKGYSGEETQSVISSLEKYGYIDDGNYSAQYITSALNKGRGSYRIMQELLRKGVDKSVIEQAFNDKETELSESMAEYEKKAALSTAVKWIDQSGDSAETGKRLASIARRLATAGYKPETVYYTLGELKKLLK